VAGPRYDIFSGTQLNNARWVEAAEALQTAVERMHTLATKSPGPYFVFSTKDGTILATIDTTKRGMRGQQLTQ